MATEHDTGEIGREPLARLEMIVFTESRICAVWPACLHGSIASTVVPQRLPLPLLTFADKMAAELLGMGNPLLDMSVECDQALLDK